METRLAAVVGFCFGVKRAVDTVYEQVQTGKTIYTYGSIVNNEEVVKELAEQGVQVIGNQQELEQLSALEDNPDTAKSEAVIIRAHGVSREVQ
ncbi:MAG: 4-hydroxy-3-methylbut-2-enyl diphosphate reductase, partial [Acetatifactor sp.]|nr:4-hydroxy-3-methylbut-2-enyl diphosphate reductase [Acetatifactor sp.]